MRNILLLKISLFLVGVTFVTCQYEPWPQPPEWTEKAKMARYLVHHSSWGVVAAISPDFGYVPFGTIQSYSDGLPGNSTGLPYFYMSSMSDTYHNIKYNATATLTVSMAESQLCQQEGRDPEEPTCARLTLVGKMVKVSDPAEEDFARKSLFSKHPAMIDWPSDHGWTFYRLQPTTMSLLDYYGGGYRVPLDDYFSAYP